ncbi:MULTISPECIES: hypothetical protein [Moraxella]|uniref:Uncharacterized protein n=2 Tax=Moraxella TaxID=475 RepID=A0A378QQ25_9GAMM|nr:MULTISPECIES: hypothetical protein [Moraxella]OPH36882.1 hypothetical protein B5J93_08880 [Moraxella equi]STZ02781.1 Uncharacterised protein [Moraxella equi]STZ56006.1 Uncharacterised protein [Moraxella lacunata]
MIEIMVTDIAKYDMVQILQKAVQGEQVILKHDNVAVSLTPNKPQADERQLAFDEFFAKMKGKLPANYEFNRDELYDRP